MNETGAKKKKCASKYHFTFLFFDISYFVHVVLPLVLLWGDGSSHNLSQWDFFLFFHSKCFIFGCFDLLNCFACVYLGDVITSLNPFSFVSECIYSLTYLNVRLCVIDNKELSLIFRPSKRSWLRGVEHFSTFKQLEWKTLNRSLLLLSGGDRQCPGDISEWGWESFSASTSQPGSADGGRAVTTCEDKWTLFTLLEEECLDGVRALCQRCLFQSCTGVLEVSLFQFIAHCPKFPSEHHCGWGWSGFCVIILVCLFTCVCVYPAHARLQMVTTSEMKYVKIWFWSTSDTVLYFLYVYVSYFFHSKFLDGYFCNA